VDEYKKSILKYQEEEWKSSSSLNLLNTSQNIVITVGLAIGLSVTTQRVVDGVWGLGNLVFFLTYLLQLYQPLNWFFIINFDRFGTYYRAIQQNFVGNNYNLIS
jgi:ABC-type transport system involved in Fe-S cluster assembly fused permease/ATPase subunit